MLAELNIEQRVDANLALARYIRAKGRAEKANQELLQECEKAQQALPEIGQYTTRIDYQDYLVTIPGDGSFTIEKIDSL